MATIVLKGFSGEIPRLAPQNLAGNQSQYAKNCKLYNGRIEPWNAALDVLNLGPLASSPQTIHAFGDYWIWWEKDIDVVRSPIVDVDDRTYFTGDDFPRVFDSTMIHASTDGSALTSYRVGIPAPAAAPTLEKQSVKKIDSSKPRGGFGMSYFGESAYAAGQLPEEVEVETDDGEESRAYVFTFVNSWGEEGPNSPPSKTIDISIGSYRTVELEGAWVLSPDGTDEYTYSGDEADSLVSAVIVDEVYHSPGTVGELERGQWAWSTSDSKLYIRLAGSEPNPNNLDDDVVIQVGWAKYVDVNGLEENYLTDTDDPTTSTPLTADHHVTKKRIYRVGTGTASGAYQFVTEIDAGVLSHRDVKLGSDLGEVLTTATYFPPPDDLIGIVLLPCNALVGFHGNEVCFSEPNKLYAWPPGYRQSVAHDIVSLGIYGNSVIIGTTEETYLFTGVDPASMIPDDNSIKKPCVSKRGTVITESGTYLPTIDGVMFVGAGGARVITTDIMKQDEWKEKNPTTIHAHFYNQNYVAYHLVDSTESFLADQLARRMENIEYYYGDEHIAGGFGMAYLGKHVLGGSKLKTVYISLNVEDGEGFFLGGGLSEGTLVRLDYAFCAFMDYESGYLFVVQKTGEGDYIIRKLDAAVQKETAIWRSKMFQLPNFIGFGAAKVIADFGEPISAARRAAYNAYRDAVIAANQALIDAGEGSGSIDAFEIDAVEIDGGGLAEIPEELPDAPTLLFRLIIDGELKFQKQVSSEEPFRLPIRSNTGESLRTRRIDYVEILTNIPIDEVRLATSITELAGGAD